MSIKLARTAGFCMGVRRAVDIVTDIVQHKKGEKVYTFGPLIHNPQTVELLNRRGIVPIDDIAEVDDGIIVIRAHGISPRQRKAIKAKGLRIIDATCPKVAKVQAIIKKHASLGYTVIIVGDKDHPEVSGLFGYASGKGIVISSPDEVGSLPDYEKVCVVAQTTQSSEQYAAIVDRIETRYSKTVIFDTICGSTERRQAEVQRLAAEMDAMVIVGGRNSANTQRLAFIARERNVPTFLIETAEELQGADTERYENIGVSAGASTPNWIIDRVIDRLTYRQGMKKGKGLKYFYPLWLFLVRTDIYTALGAAALALVSMLLQKLPLQFANLMIVALYVYAVHTMNRVRANGHTGIEGSFREDAYTGSRSFFYILSIVFLIGAHLLAWTQSYAAFGGVLAVSLPGFLYNIKIFPQAWPLHKLEDIPASKNICIAAAWAFVIALIPPLGLYNTVDLPALTVFLIMFAFVFIKSALSDMSDIQSDRLVGRETIPAVLGIDKTKRLLRGISLILAFLLIGSYFTGLVTALSLLLITALFYIWICLEIYDKKIRFSNIVFEGVLGTGYLIAGLCGIVWYLVS